MRNKMKVVGNIQVAGIYVMKDADGIVRYVGSGISCADRLSSHLYFLKRNLYTGTNKQILQDIYDREELTFEIIKISASNNDVATMSSSEKICLQKALSVLEEFYIGMYKDTISNSQMKVTKFSTSPTKITTELRRNKNKGSKNPNNKVSEKLVSEILYLKNAGLKPKAIVELLESQGIEVSSGYISPLGVTRWIHMEPKKPKYYEEVAN